MYEVREILIPARKSRVEMISGTPEEEAASLVEKAEKRSKGTVMIFVITEHKDNKLKPITSELLVFAQRVGRDFGQPVTAVVLGSSTASLADELKTRKIDRVITANMPISVNTTRTRTWKS